MFLISWIQSFGFFGFLFLGGLIGNTNPKKMGGGGGIEMLFCWSPMRQKKTNPYFSFHGETKLQRIHCYTQNLHHSNYLLGWVFGILCIEIARNSVDVPDLSYCLMNQ